MWFSLTVTLAVLSLMEFPIHFHATASAKNNKNDRQKKSSVGSTAGDVCSKVMKSAVDKIKFKQNPSFTGSLSRSESQGSHGSQRKSIDSCTSKNQTPYQRFRLRMQRNESLRRLKRNFSRAGTWLNVDKMAKASAIIREQARRVENNLLDYLSRDASEETTFLADTAHMQIVKDYMPSLEKTALPEESPDVFGMNPTPEDNVQTTDVEAVKRYCIRRCLTIYGYVFDELMPESMSGTMTTENAIGKGRVIPLTQGIIYRASNGQGSPTRTPPRLIRSESFSRFVCECKTRQDFTNLMTGMELDMEEFNRLKKDSSRKALSSLKTPLAMAGVKTLTHKEVIGLLYLQMRKHENPYPLRTLPYKIRNEVLEAIGVLGQSTKDENDYWWKITV